MYKEHPRFVKPENQDIKIWRYFDFTKFVSLLEKRALFFVRADKLEDPFEGAVTAVDVQQREDFFKEHGIPINDYLKGNMWRKFVTINSWHENDYESAAMWKLYLKSDEGIAVQTTFNRLCDSFNVHSEDDIFIGRVRYTDYETEIIPSGNIFIPFLHKRKSFEHEREIRALVCRFPVIENKLNFMVEKFESGIYVNIDLNLLTQRIYVSPYSKKWFLELVSAISKKYGIEAEVSASSLLAVPAY